MLLHEPDRFHEVDQQHDCLLAHESNACASNVGELGRRDLIFGLVSILIHVDLARDPGLHTLERAELRAKWRERRTSRLALQGRRRIKNFCIPSSTPSRS